MSDANFFKRGADETGDQEISEDLFIPSGLHNPLSEREARQRRTDTTRRWLAWGIAGSLILLHLIAVLAVALGGLTPEQLVTVVGALSGVQTLAAAAVGFYFGRNPTD